ncbi:hypothetical protein PMAYCL1PPCAC_05061, partial [Pristionchus mayeri]
RSCRFQKCLDSGMNANAIQWPACNKGASVSSLSELEYGTDFGDSPPIAQRIITLPRTIVNIPELNYCGEIAN